MQVWITSTEGKSLNWFKVTCSTLSSPFPVSAFNLHQAPHARITPGNSTGGSLNLPLFTHTHTHKTQAWFLPFLTEEVFTPTPSSVWSFCAQLGSAQQDSVRSVHLPPEWAGIVSPSGILLPWTIKEPSNPPHTPTPQTEELDPQTQFSQPLFRRWEAAAVWAPYSQVGESKGWMNG